MTEIEMERKPRRNTWIWIAAALLVVVIAVGAYLLYERGATGYEVAPAAERPGATEPYVERPAPDQPYVEPGEQPGTRDPVRTPPDAPRP
jgi:hypothetical protein